MSNYVQRLKKVGGNPQVFNSPEELITKSVEYFEWCKANPIEKNELVKSGDLAGSIIPVPIDRPFTITGLCAFLSISRTSFFNYENKEEVPYGKFNHAVKCIRNILTTQKLERAITGLYSPSLVGRMEGISEKVEVEQTIVERQSLGWSEEE